MLYYSNHDEDGYDDEFDDDDDDGDDNHCADGDEYSNDYDTITIIGERMIGNSSYSAYDHAVVHKNFIRLTSDHEHKTGAIWTRRRLCMIYYLDVMYMMCDMIMFVMCDVIYDV